MATTNNELYRVRKSWDNAKSQIGAYSVLNNAKRACDNAGLEYYVFNSAGTIVYPIANSSVIVDTSAADSKIIWNYLKQAGLNDFGIAGLMGNLQAESGLRPTNLQNTFEKSLNMTDAEYTIKVDNGEHDFINDKAGYGLAQWTWWSRKQNLLNYCKSKNKSIGDLNTQLEFLVKELTTNYTNSVWNVIKNATSVRHASDVVLFKFEAPADQSVKVQETRAALGQTFYDKYAAPISIAPNATSKFTPRLTEPSTSDKYWIHVNGGGLNECIKIEGNSCLPNCVGYAWGRFYEIIGKRPALSRANAEDWYDYKDGYTRSQLPVEGAVICWRKGQTGNGSDGAGHVAIVEEVKSNGDIITSNSGYKSTRFYIKTITKASGYSYGSAYTFQGFILPPGTSAPTESQTIIKLPSEGVNGKMKYSSTNKPLACMQTNSTCYKGTSRMNVKGILWHSTGANNPTLKRYVQPSDDAIDRDQWIQLLGKNAYNNDWNHITHQAGLNAWIGKLADGTVTTVQTMPWDYKPWGCGSGSKGSCNNGWIQFEICEDGLTDKTYFNKVYKEACELTAYLCDMYNLDPNGTVDYNGVAVPVILDHATSHGLQLGSNHGDIYHWFSKYGKSMNTVRKDVTELLGKDDLGSVTPVNPVEPEVKVYYRVRKAWTDTASQKGAYTILENAKKRVDELGAGYYVFDESGKAIYPEVTVEPTAPTTVNGLKEGDAAKLIAGAKYTSGGVIPTWVINSKIYIRDIRANGDVVFSTLQTGAITGVTAGANLQPYSVNNNITPSADATIKKGNKVKLLPGATYTNGRTIPTWVFEKTLYAREVRDNGDIIISTLQSGAITGVVNKKYLQLAEAASLYSVKVTVSVLNIRSDASTSSPVVAQTKNGDIHEIYEVKGYWGRTKSGWIYLTYTKRI